jgi:hypothetical protein
MLKCWILNHSQVVYERLWDAVWVHPQEVIDEGTVCRKPAAAAAVHVLWVHMPRVTT